MIDKRKQEEEAWYSQQQQLMNAEEQRRKIMQIEEKKLTDQRARYSQPLPSPSSGSAHITPLPQIAGVET